MQYFGKTGNDPFSYKGSGKYWKRHLSTHGDYVNTIIIGYFEESDRMLVDYALGFSAANNIVLSQQWANLQAENGLDGNPIGNVPWNKNKKGSQIAWNKGVPRTPRERKSISNGMSEMSTKSKNTRRKNISEEYHSRSNKEKTQRQTLREKTCISKYGYKNPSQNPEVLEKSLKTRANRTPEEKKETKRKQSIAKKGIQQPKTLCPHCGKLGGKSNMTRYHFNNCKQLEGK